MSTNPFASNAFTKGLADTQARADASRIANSNTSQQRMGLGDTSSTPGTSNTSAAQNTSFNNTNNAMANNPVFQAGQRIVDRNFTEDSRRFDAALGAKSSALANEQSTIRYQSDNSLSGVKYNADAGVKSTQIGANAQMYGADRQLDGVRLQTDASRYGADRGYQASIYSADRNLEGNRYVADSNVRSSQIGANAQVDSARIGADASRFNALLSTGVGFFNSSQYRPTFNR